MVMAALEVDGSVKARVIYSTTYEPDPTDARTVIAFLMVPDDAFVDADASICERADVSKYLAESKRAALLRWYASHLEAEEKRP